MQNYKQALENYKKTYPPNHPDIADTLSNMAIIYLDNGQHEIALQTYKEALRIYKKNTQGNQTKLPTHYITLG